ncbi:MAG: hypothetical protein ACTTIC_07140 [Helicobacteraceae bacterium]
MIECSVNKILLLVIILFSSWFSSCADRSERLLYSQKSCEALEWDLGIVEKEIARSRVIDAGFKKDYTGLTITGTGALLSAAYIAFAGLSNQYIYVLPALTVLYYNKGVRHNGAASKLENLTNKKDMITGLLKEKSCARH